MTHRMPFLVLTLSGLACLACRDKKGDVVDAGALDSNVVETASRCGASSIPLYEPVTPRVTRVAPSATALEGEVIRDRGGDHFVVTPPGGATRDELFVWLGGSGFATNDYTEVMTVAATAGYRGVSLAYANAVSVDSQCNRASPTECDETHPDGADCDLLVRAEIIYGTDYGTCVTVNASDSIVTRLNRLLRHLDGTLGYEGFDRYFDGDAIVWENIVIAGWSQGGGHAGVIARDHCVARALYVSKGAGVIGLDDDSGIDLVRWASDPRATPPEREFGSTHTLERAMAYSPMVFDLWGIPGEYEDVDDLWEDPTAGFDALDCTHRVTTQAAPAAGCRQTALPAAYHPTMASDDCLALDAYDEPILAPAYYYFLSVELDDADCRETIQ